MKLISVKITMSLILLIFVSFFQIKGLTGYKINIVKNPRPTCEEKLFTELVKTGEVSVNIEDENFLILPFELAVSKEGNIFVFDSKQTKIFCYNKNLKLIDIFSKHGRGPSELGSRPHHAGAIFMEVGEDNNLYVGDRYNTAIHCFNSKGAFIKDIRLRTMGSPSIIPVMDMKGNFYSYSGFKGEKIIDVFNKNGEQITSLIDRKELGNCLYSEPIRKESKTRIFYSGPNTFLLQSTVDNRIVVYLSEPSALFILKDYKIQKKINLLPLNALKEYKEKKEEALKSDSTVTIFQSMITDKDNKNNFYLEYGVTKDKKRHLLYMFDYNGKLKQVYYIKLLTKGIFHIKYKRNGIFYAIGTGEDEEKTIITLKEAKEK